MRTVDDRVMEDQCNQSVLTTLRVATNDESDHLDRSAGALISSSRRNTRRKRQKIDSFFFFSLSREMMATQLLILLLLTCVGSSRLQQTSSVVVAAGTDRKSPSNSDNRVRRKRGEERTLQERTTSSPQQKQQQIEHQILKDRLHLLDTVTATSNGSGGQASSVHRQRQTTNKANTNKQAVRKLLPYLDDTSTSSTSSATTTTVCTCSPQIYNVKINLSSTSTNNNPCDIDDLSTNRGIKATLCLYTPSPSGGLYNPPVPVPTTPSSTDGPSVIGNGDDDPFRPPPTPTNVGSDINNDMMTIPPSSSSTTNTMATNKPTTGSSSSTGEDDPFRPPPIADDGNMFQTYSPTITPHPTTLWPTFTPTTLFPSYNNDNDATVEGGSSSSGTKRQRSDSFGGGSWLDDDGRPTQPPLNQQHHGGDKAGGGVGEDGKKSLRRSSNSISTDDDELIGPHHHLHHHHTYFEGEGGGGSSPTQAKTTYYPTFSDYDDVGDDRKLSLKEKQSTGRKRLQVINVDESSKGGEDGYDELAIPQTTLGKWTSIHPNDEFFDRHPEFQSHQEQIYRMKHGLPSATSSSASSSFTRSLQGALLIPTQLISAQFLEMDTSPNMQIINQDDQYLNMTFPDSSNIVLQFSSISNLLNPAIPLGDQMEYVPGGVILILVGSTESGEIVRNRNMWTYTLGCGKEDYTVLDGNMIGWAGFEKLTPAREEFCPSSGNLPSPPTPSPNVVVTPTPSSYSPTSTPPSPTTTIPQPTTILPTKKPSSTPPTTKKPSMSMGSGDIFDHFDLSGKAKKKKNKRRRIDGRHLDKIKEDFRTLRRRESVMEFGRPLQ